MRQACVIWDCRHLAPLPAICCRTPPSAHCSGWPLASCQLRPALHPPLPCHLLFHPTSLAFFVHPVISQWQLAGGVEGRRRQPAGRSTCRPHAYASRLGQAVAWLRSKVTRPPFFFSGPHACYALAAFQGWRFPATHITSHSSAGAWPGSAVHAVRRPPISRSNTRTMTAARAPTPRTRGSHAALASVACCPHGSCLHRTTRRRRYARAPGGKPCSSGARGVDI